jgi:2-amino-4-hydroxy-6-hydroxymethyldihydropteridine diphosphokinase
VRAYLGLGSNLGEREAHLAGAVRSLHELDPKLVVSSLYETSPVGGPEDQGPYLNCVVALETSLTPRELLGVGQRLENEAARVRTVRNGPRTLDVDLLLLDDLVIDEEDLVVPHPRMYERAFVLAPLEELDPRLVPAGWREKLLGQPGTGQPGTGQPVRRVGTLSLS